jgi:CRISPR-associated protein Csc1
MQLLRCTITLHDSLYYATREMGTLFETERYLHNYALSYALCGEWTLFADLLVRSFFCASYRPEYASDLPRLNRRSVYITPAMPISWEYLLVTWKMGQVTYYRKPERFGERGNYPDNYGRAKELAPESTFRCYVLSERPIALPRWIRLGKWHSKALVETAEIEVKQRSGEYVAAGPLNPLDVPAGVLRAFDIVSMPPSSLVANARCAGEHYELERGVGLPVGMRYTFPT